MNMKELFGKGYRESDEAYTQAFEDLIKRVQNYCQRYNISDSPERGAVVVLGNDARKFRNRLSTYQELDDREREHLFDCYKQDSKSLGLHEIASVLGVFGKDMAVYDELKARLAIRYRIVDEYGGERWEASNFLQKNAYFEFDRARETMQRFTGKFKRLDERVKGPLTWTLGDLVTLAEEPGLIAGIKLDKPTSSGWIYGRERESMGRIFGYVQGKIPEHIDEIGNPEGLEGMGFSRQSQFIYNNRRKIFELNRSIESANRRNWIDRFVAAINGGVLEEFSKLSPQDLQLLYQATDVAVDASNRLPASKAISGGARDKVIKPFNDGFVKSLASGNIVPWAKTIVDYFREGSVGGENYRVLVEGSAA